MTDFMMLGKMANQVAGAYGQYSTSKIQFQMQESARKHKEAMTALSAAQQFNAVTVQEAQTRDAGMRAAVSLNMQSLGNRSAAEVQAAAAGVAGNSVDQTMIQLERSALSANAARKLTLKSKRQAHGQQRKNIRMQQIYGRDISTPIPPSPTSALLGLGMTLLNSYNENQPKGETTSDRLAAFFQ